MSQVSIVRGDYNSADKCRENGWTVGTRLAGDEGYGVTVIQITAIGEAKILAKRISHKDEPCGDDEGNWTLRFRDWKRVD